MTRIRGYIQVTALSVCSSLQALISILRRVYSERAAGLKLTILSTYLLLISICSGSLWLSYSCASLSGSSIYLSRRHSVHVQWTAPPMLMRLISQRKVYGKNLSRGSPAALEIFLQHRLVFSVLLGPSTAPPGILATNGLTNFRLLIRCLSNTTRIPV